MKKLKFFMLSILVIFGAVIFSACNQQEVKVDGIDVSETSISLRTGETVEINVTITPENATNKEFKIIGNHSDVMSSQVDIKNMKIVLTGNNQIIPGKSNATIAVRTLDGDFDKIITVNLTNEENVSTPQNFTFDGQYLSWDEVEGAVKYTLLINREEKIVTDNRYPLDLMRYENRSVSASVKANGKSRNLDSSFTEQLNFSIFKKPENLYISVEPDGNTNRELKILTWDVVEGAEAYVVLINNREVRCETNSLDITDYVAEPIRYDLKVKVDSILPQNKYNSAYTDSYSVESLSAPDNLTISNGVLRWDTVSSANVKYKVLYTCAKNGVFEEKVHITKNTYFTLPFDIDVGEYSARVGAIGDGSSTLSSDFGDIVRYTKLDSVENVRIENDYIVWNKVEKATAYIIYFNNILNVSGNSITDERIVQTADAHFVTYSIPEDLGAGDFKINIQAIGQEDKIPSNLMANDFWAHKLSKPTNIQISKDDNNKCAITWKKVENATSYQIIIERPDDIEYHNVFNISQSNLEYITVANIPNLENAGNYMVSITAIGGKIGEITYLNSNKSNKLEILKLNTPTLITTNLQNGILSWGKIASAGSYSVLVKKDGSEDMLHTVTTTNIDLNSFEYHISDGISKVCVKANAISNQNVLDGEFCEFILVNKLTSKSVVVKNGTIENLETDEDSNYQYRYEITDEKGRKSAVNDIKNYVNNVIESGIKCAINVIAIPKQSQISGDDVTIHYVRSDSSSTIYVKKLPTITDIKMVDGCLYFGSQYENISGYEFNLYIDAETDDIVKNLDTDRVYDFNSIQAGSYNVRIQAFSNEFDDDTLHDENHPFNLNSKMSNQYYFKKLAIPNGFTISSFADDKTYLNQALLAAESYSVENSGALTWVNVEDATNYELRFADSQLSIFTNRNYHSLQGTSILSGDETSVKIRAIGNGSNIITSDYSVQPVLLTKLYSPDIVTLTVDENGKKIVNWDYSDNSKDPNRGFNITSLLNDNCKLAMYILVEKVGSNIIYYPATTSLDSISSNKCQLPQNLSGNSTIRILAVPFNTYISELLISDYSSSKILKVKNTALQIVSDYSPEISLQRLQTPLNLKLENQNPEDLNNSKNILSWSKLDYIEGVLDEYVITIKATKNENEDDEKNYAFSVSTHNTELPTIIVDDLSKANNCKWEFNKLNFEMLFGEGTYIPNVYSISIKAVSCYDAKYSVGDRTVYYIDSYSSTAVNVEVLDSPDISVVSGVVTWSKIQNADKYGLTIILPNGNTKYIVVAKEDTTISLQSDGTNYYPSGEYKLDIVAIGDGSTTITSESREEDGYTELTKLDAVEGLKIENGIIAYSGHSIVDSSVGENCSFVLYIHSSKPNSKPVEELNDKLHSFELLDENKFPGGLTYTISVRANGDNRSYINSDLSDEVSAYKFATPSGIKISDGKLTWIRVGGVTKYLINVSGGEHDFSVTEITNSYKFDGIEGSTYHVEIKAIGDSLSLNSSVAVINNIEKLTSIEEFELSNGYLKWKFVSGSNYRLVVDNTKEIAISENNAEIVMENGQGYIYYKLSDIQLNQDEHVICVYNYGGDIKISSLATIPVKIKKLSKPSNLSVDKETFKFVGVENAENYAIKVIVTLSQNTTKEYIFIPQDMDEYNVQGDYITIDFAKLQVEILNGLCLDVNTSIESYNLSVYAVGSSQASLNESVVYYLSSNESESLRIEQPSATKVYFETDAGLVQNVSAGTFYGKIVWDKVEDADYYKVFVNAFEDSHKVLFGYEIVSPIDDINSSHNGYSCYIIPDKNKNYANVIYRDYDYSFIVVACKNKDGFDSLDSNKLTGLDYSIFSSEQDGLTAETAYEIASETEFGYIRYNLEARYKLTKDIAFEVVPHSIASVIPFTGTFDGNNHILQGKDGEYFVNLNISSSNNTFEGLFGKIGENGCVKNVIFKANIYSSKIINNVINVPYIARENYGLIQNIKTIGTIGTEYNSDTYMICAAGISIYNYGNIDYCLSEVSIAAKNNLKEVYAAGITVYNYGTVSKTGFTGSATGQIVAGIAGQNFGKISECYYEGDTEDTFILSNNNGVQDNYAAGIAAYMQGENSLIEYCYSNGRITGTTISSKTAYVGGLVGYLKAGTLKFSYSIGCKNNQAIITATGNELDTIKVGVIVGATEARNENGAKVVYVKLGTQKVSGTGTIINIEETTVEGLDSSLRNFQSYFDISSTYPKLKNAKRN